MIKKTKNKNQLILFVLLLILVLILLFFNNRDKKFNSLSNQGEVLIENPELIVKDSYEIKEMEVEDSYATFDIKYPYFKYSDNNFNLKIEEFLNEQINNQKKYAKEGWEARYNTQGEGEKIPSKPPKDEKWPFYTDVKIIQSNQSFISFVLTYGGFTGGAHGYENRVSYNYDVKNNKEMTLKDVFPTNFKYLDYLSTESRKELVKSYAVLSEEDKANSSPEAVQEYINNMISMIDEGTTSKEENFTTFTFTPEKIKIYFAQYQVGPYVIGMPEVELSRE